MKIASREIIDLDFYTVCKQTWFSFFHNLFFFKVCKRIIIAEFLVERWK